MKVSAYIIAYNEAKKIADTINSVLWADEIIVADSASTDETARIALDMGARVVQIPFQGFGHLRNQAVESCAHEWIFSLDTDEQCTPEVRDEVLMILSGISCTTHILCQGKLLHGTLDRTFRLVSEFPPASVISERGHEICGISCS